MNTPAYRMYLAALLSGILHSPFGFNHIPSWEKINAYSQHGNYGIALSPEQYKGLAAGFARPEAVYWDARHNNALYILPDEEPDWCVVMPLYMPGKNKAALKKLGRFDGVATAYRELRSALLGRRLEKIR